MTTLTPEQMAGRAIRLERQRQGMSQEALGQLIGLRQMTVARTEAGTRPLRVDELFRIAGVLGVEPGSLVPLGNKDAVDDDRLARLNSYITRTAAQMLDTVVA